VNLLRDFNLPAKKEQKSARKSGPQVGCALVFASEAKIEIEAKISVHICAANFLALLNLLKGKV